MHFNYHGLFSVCWGAVQLRTILQICKSLWCNGLCLVPHTEGELLLESETYPARASLSDPEVSTSMCDIMQRIMCHIFLPHSLSCIPLFPAQCRSQG